MYGNLYQNNDEFLKINRNSSDMGDSLVNNELCVLCMLNQSRMADTSRGDLNWWYIFLH